MWDALTHVQLLSWRAHTGGVLQLLPLSNASNGTHDGGHSHFLSQGRDGCIHCWRLDARRSTSAADEVDAALCDLVGDLPSLEPATASVSTDSRFTPGSSTAVLQQQTSGELTSFDEGVKLPEKLWTLRAGFGGFCRASLLSTTGYIPSTSSTPASLQCHHKKPQNVSTTRHAGGRYVPEQEPESVTLVLSTPSIDGSGMDLWAFPSPEDMSQRPLLLSRARVPPAAAEHVARALGRLKDVEDGTIAEHSSLTDTLKSTGMVMSCELVFVPAYNHVMPAQAAAGRQQQQDSHGSSAVQAPAEEVWPVPHPQAHSLRELLQTASRARTVPPHGTPHAHSTGDAVTRSQEPVAGVLTVACYENGGVYVLDQGPLVLPHRPPPQCDGDGSAASADEPPMSTLDAAQLCTAIVSLPVCTVPIMSMALIASKTHPGIFTGCCTTSGPSLYVFSLNVLHRTGCLMHALTMSSPGASLCVPWYGVHGSAGAAGTERAVATFLVGCWDGSLRVVQQSEGQGAQAEDAQAGGAASTVDHQCHKWQSSSMYAIAYRGDVVVTGCQDGKLSMTSLSAVMSDSAVQL